MLGQKIELFETLPIFRGLSRKQLGSIVDVTAKAFFEASENLIERGKIGDTAYLILTGAAKCLDFPGTPVASNAIEAGSLVGELAMLVDTVHAFSVQAKVRVRALALHRDALREAMQSDPAIARQISDNLLDRLQSFARDLKRLDSILAKIEDSPPFEGDLYARLAEPRVTSFLRQPKLPQIVEREALSSG